MKKKAGKRPGVQRQCTQLGSSLTEQMVRLRDTFFVVQLVKDPVKAVCADGYISSCVHRSFLIALHLCCYLFRCVCVSMGIEPSPVITYSEKTHTMLFAQMSNTTSEPDELLKNDLMEGRWAFLQLARDNHFQVCM